MDVLEEYKLTIVYRPDLTFGRGCLIYRRTHLLGGEVANLHFTQIFRLFFPSPKLWIVLKVEGAAADYDFSFRRGGERVKDRFSAHIPRLTRMCTCPAKCIELVEEEHLPLLCFERCETYAGGVWKTQSLPAKPRGVPS
jgi:hypothetical protein